MPSNLPGGASDNRNQRYRWLAPLALAVGALYLIWRVGWTRNGTQPVLFWSLWIAEVTVWLSLLRLAWETWTPTTDIATASTSDYSVILAILIRYEPVEVIRACLFAADSVRHPHETLLVDSVGRDDVAKFAKENDCAVRVEPILERDPIHACLRGLLADAKEDLVAVIHASSVARPGFIDELIGDFDDPDVWAAQGRQSIFGSAPGEFASGTTERELFGRILQPGKNHHGAALWSGDGSLVRVRAVVELDGLPDSTDSPVFQTSVRAASRGWRCTFHSATSTMAMTTLDVGRFVSHRAVWARGHLQLLRTRDNPAFAHGLSLPQRLSFLGTLSTYLSGPRRLVLVLVVCATLLSGRLPIDAAPGLLIPVVAAWALLYRDATRALAEPGGNPAAAARQRWILVGAYCAGFAELLLPRSWTHTLIRRPPHGHSLVPASNWEPIGHARLLATLFVVAACSAVARLLAAVGLLDLPAIPTAAVLPLVLATAYLVGVMGSVLASVSRPTRSQVRFRVQGTAAIGGSIHTVLDMAEGGAAVVFSRPPVVGETLLVTLGVPGLDGRLHPATVASEVRWVRPRPAETAGVEGKYAVGLEFTHMSPTAQRRIMMCCRVVLPAAEPPRRQRLPSTSPEAPRVRTT